MSFATWAGSLAILVTFVAPAVAQDRGSEADQEACTPDVFRLCQSFIPDEGRILACLQSSGKQLSPACHRVIFSSPAPAKKMREAQASVPQLTDTDRRPTGSIHRHRRHVVAD